MTSTFRRFASTALLARAANACAPEDDPCATPGIAFVWAGTGERGFNKEDPDAHR